MSCNDSSSKRFPYDNNSLSNSIAEDAAQQMYTCPMCGGTGVFEYMSGDVMAPNEVCKGCDGNKVVTEEQAREIMQVKEQVDAFMNGGTLGGGNYNPGNNGRSVYEIRRELNEAYELLEDMEYNYENCTGVVTASQYPSMIAAQKARISQLEAELMNAQ